MLASSARKVSGLVFRRDAVAAIRFATRSAGRGLSSEASAPEDHAMSEKVSKLLDEIVVLNMLEVKQLSTGLKDRLGIADAVPMMGMPMGAPMAGSAAPASEAEEPVAEEKTHFDIKLEAFDAGKKIQIIKEVRTLTSLGLKEAKALVDAAPGVIKEGVSKEDAEQMKATLTDLGATISLE